MPLAEASPSHWFAVYTAPRHEKRISEHLSLRGIEHFLPLCSVPRRWKDGSKGIVEQPLFPHYLFVHITRRERARVLEVPGVHTIVGAGREPLPLPKFEIESLRSGLHLRKCEPHPLLTAGRKARIRTGALAGMEGVVIRTKQNYRIVLTLDLIKQSVAVELDAADIEPILQSLTATPA